MSESKQRGDAVAVVGTTYQLLWVGSGPIATIVEQHGIKVGDRLYHGPAAEAAPELVEALAYFLGAYEHWMDAGGSLAEDMMGLGSEKARAALAKAGA
ncbi:hypothetical protein [Burkholderia gladioli]|uniref:hypothetical protein n=1 Tax=Burkholderia gladioli TaxID=28095 RepID=UPI001641B4E2|nr:hypothetical protein [Burkholderia gladioli]